MSEVKVNKISPRTNCGTVTLGDSGDSFVIPSGVTITNSGTAAGFGSTGEVSWNTTKITADPGPAVSGVGYFTDTSGAAFNITLPSSPSAGAVVAVADYANTWDTNSLTIARNGSNIEGDASNFECNTEGAAITFVYVDATKGWIATNTANSTDASTTKFVTATGGTITTSGNFKIHTFTGPGTFCVSCAGNSLGSNTVDYLVVAGAGGGGGSYPNYYSGGGGGAGGYRESGGTASGCYTVSPLGSSPSPVAALPVPATAYPITVGAGGGGGPASPRCRGCSGSNSIFSTITSAGGGYGGRSGGDPAQNGTQGGGGGSGGGTGGYVPSPQAAGGTGNNPPVSPPQGNPGGAGTIPSSGQGGAGGGATAAGAAGGSGHGTNGGAGATSSINGTPTTRSKGGDGGTPGGSATAGGANTGNGGTSGHNSPLAGAAGGSGIVIIRYKFQ